MHLFPLIQDLAVMLGVATAASLAFQWLRQPVVLGYLVAGIVVGPHTPPFSLVADEAGVRIWAELGVIFLMFAVGLEFSFRRLAKVGATAVFAGPFEAVCMIGLGFGAGWLAGWETLDCLFLGAILAISSTTIIIKALEELGLKNEPFAELVLGVLIVEDLAGILLIVVLTALVGDGLTLSGVAWAFGKLALIVGGWIVIGTLTVPRLVNHVSRKFNDETLVILALGLCLGLVVFAGRFGYSSALGAFVMGSIIAECDERHRIERLIGPIRDLFAAVFFVSVGMLLDPSDLVAQWRLVLAISALTIVGKIASTSLGARLMGRPGRMSLQVGLSLAQIGEFSFIIAGVGLTLGVMRRDLYALAVSVSVVTTFTTPYFIRLARRVGAPAPA